MGRAIIGGVITSTLLTLVVVPVLYMYLDRWSEARKGRQARKTAAAAASPEAASGSAGE
jgi:HAE1 family hydrophobic/amphiphilic exporter-1